MYQNIYIDNFQQKVHIWDDKKGHCVYSLSELNYAFVKDPNGKYRSLNGEKLSITNYYTPNDPEVYESDVPLETKILVKLYLNNDEPSEGHNICYIDIETETEGGFPNVNLADKKIISISFFDSATQTFNAYILDPDKLISNSRSRTTNLKIKEKVFTYKVFIHSFQDEESLLKSFLRKWQECSFTIVTGWNTDRFDILYLYNRINKILGKTETNKLSPIRNVYLSKLTNTVKIAGISCLDYMNLYKKYIGKDKPSFSLNFIGKEELGMEKISYKGNLNELYKNDINKFLEYNLTDVKIVLALDKVLDFIFLARSVCHKGHVPYEWYEHSSRWIDGSIITFLHRKNIAVPNKPLDGKTHYQKILNEEEEFEGAFVKNPKPGLYDWVYSCDIQSLYPSTIMTLNISPETKIGKVEQWDPEEFFLSDKEITICFNGKEFSRSEFLKFIKSNNYSISGNGVIYRNDFRGVVPSILEQWFKERLEYKELCKKYKEEGNQELEEFYERRQKRQKIFLNSVYGTLGLPIFRFYDKDNAEATTISGQKIIKSTEKFVNSVYKEMGLKEMDYVIYIDTDSVYCSAKPLLDNNNIPEEQYKKFTIDLSKNISSKINEFYDILIPVLFNVSTHRIKIIPDTIASAGFWVSKKRYALLKVYDMEKQRDIKSSDGKEGSVEIKGIDVVRTSFPQKFRLFSGEILEMILRKYDKKFIDQKIIHFEKNINSMSVVDISKNTSVKFVSVKGDINYNPPNRKPFQIMLKTPAQVAASLMYNDMLKKQNLDKLYQPIFEGQKIKWTYLKPNPMGIKAMAFKNDGTDPDSFMEFLEKYSDREKMFEKELKPKLEKFYTSLNWEFPSDQQSFLSHLF